MFFFFSKVNPNASGFQLSEKCCEVLPSPLPNLSCTSLPPGLSHLPAHSGQELPSGHIWFPLALAAPPVNALCQAHPLLQPCSDLWSWGAGASSGTRGIFQPWATRCSGENPAACFLLPTRGAVQPTDRLGKAACA